MAASDAQVTEAGGQPSLVGKAQALGHVMSWDPSAALSSVTRLTCTDCGRAALNAGGPDYGSALTDACTSPAATSSPVVPEGDPKP